MTEPIPYQPYQAYRSKRHSRGTSNSRVVSDVPTISRPGSVVADEKGILILDTSKDLPLSPPNPTKELPPSPPPPPPVPEAATVPVMPAANTSPIASTSSSSAKSPAKKVSTFRRIPRNKPLAPSPLAHSRPTSSASMQPPSISEAPVERLLAADAPQSRPLSSISILPPPAKDASPRVSPLPSPTTNGAPPLIVPTRTSSLSSAHASPPPLAPSPPRSQNQSPQPHSRPPQAKAPYRPGFQPKGVYRPRTDEFLALRKQKHEGGHKRVERTKLERRLEKIITLHFPPSNGTKRPEVRQRTSSLFSVLVGVGVGAGGQDDVRSAEQRITPWEEDAAVTKCPLCLTSFHPLTNRKHHCRLCGKIICSLPPKLPHRPTPCSLLFVVDPKTRKIEEVGEGVDYGVRKRRVSANGIEQGEEEKFLKGVRTCRECRPVLLRAQYVQEGAGGGGIFEKLYDAFIALEKEIQDCLPQFQELVLSLSSSQQPTAASNHEAAILRKRLISLFGQYEALAKRIRTLPCLKGSSQERVQAAVGLRAAGFLERELVPLQSLPKFNPTPKHKSSKSMSSLNGGSGGPTNGLVDPDSQTAILLQPLLEQEALLEGFVEEARVQRKFEDVKTLRGNLGEIRAEIERILATAERQGR